MSTTAAIETPLAGDQLEAMLRGAGLKVTRPRLAVLRALHGHPHISADALVTLVREELPSASLQSTYNVLTALADRGLVRRIEPAGHAGRYELRVGDNHHHAVCTGCGAITDIDCAVGHAPCLTPQAAHDFSVEQAEVTFWGQCADCQSRHQSSEEDS